MRRTALITGASGGIGMEYAKILAADGFNLVVVARGEGKLIALKEELERTYSVQVSTFACDLSQPGASEKVFNYTQENNITVDILVNNAGFGDFGNFWEVDMKKQNDLMQVNMIVLVQLSRLYMPQMIEQHYGRILNMSSVAAFCAGPRMPLYYASKEFVRCFSEGLYEETKGTGVTVTALCPGPTATGFEKAAEMKKSKMFSFVGTSSAHEVAEAGVKAMMEGKALEYYSIPTKLMNIGSRIMPRSVSRKFAKFING